MLRVSTLDPLSPLLYLSFAPFPIPTRCLLPWVQGSCSFRLQMTFLLKVKCNSQTHQTQLLCSIWQLFQMLLFFLKTLSQLSLQVTMLYSPGLARATLSHRCWLSFLPGSKLWRSQSQAPFSIYIHSLGDHSDCANDSKTDISSFCFSSEVPKAYLTLHSDV